MATSRHTPSFSHYLYRRLRSYLNQARHVEMSNWLGLINPPGLLEYIFRSVLAVRPLDGDGIGSSTIARRSDPQLFIDRFEKKLRNLRKCSAATLGSSVPRHFHRLRAWSSAPSRPGCHRNAERTPQKLHAANGDPLGRECGASGRLSAPCDAGRPVKQV